MRALLLSLALIASQAFAAPPTLFSGRPQAFERAPKAPIVGVYVANWQPVELVDQLKDGSLSHILYAFMRICGPGQRAMDEALCAGRPEFTLGVSDKETEFNAAFLRLKQRMPQLKVVASVGGWAGSDSFFYLANDPAKRAVFAASVVEFLRSHPGFDGVDIDWEHPGNNGAANGVQLGSPADGQGYADLMTDLRTAVDGLGRETGRSYLVTTAVNTASKIIKGINFRQAARALDLIFMMTYDFYGPWTDKAGAHSALASSSPDAEDSLMAGVSTMVRAGVPAAKLVAGMAMYGRGFAGVKQQQSVAAKTGEFPADGISGEAGAASYKRIAEQWLGPEGKGRGGFVARFDKVTQAWSLWNAKTGDFMGYDDPRSVILKAQYAKRAGLAGVFAWELSQDNGDVLNAMNLGVGNKSLK